MEYIFFSLTTFFKKIPYLVKLLIFKKNLLYHYEHSRHKRRISVILDLFPKISRRYLILRGNVVTEL